MTENDQKPSRRRRAGGSETDMPATPGAGNDARLSGSARRRRHCDPQAVAAADPAPHGCDGRLRSPGTATRAATSGAEKKVGYRRPPESGRFKPGQSGNPGGRPKGSRNRNRNVLGESLAAIFLAESERLVADPSGATGETISAKQAIVRSLLRRACDGKGAKVVLDALAGSEAQIRTRQRTVLQDVEDYITQTRDEIAACIANGMDPPDPFPHPDEIFVNHEAGTVLILGTCEIPQKMALHAYCTRTRQEIKAEVEALTELLGEPRFAPYKEQLTEEIEAERDLLTLFDRWLGFLNPRRRPRFSTPKPKPPAGTDM